MHCEGKMQNRKIASKLFEETLGTQISSHILCYQRPSSLHLRRGMYIYIFMLWKSKTEYLWIEEPQEELRTRNNRGEHQK